MADSGDPTPTPPPGPPSPQQEARPATPPKTRGWKRDVALVVGTAVLVLVGQAVFFGDDDSNDDVDTATTPPGETDDEDDARQDDSSDTTDRGETTSTTGESRGPQESFDDGVWTVGDDIEAGLYIATDIDNPPCNWSRLSDVSADQVIAGDTRVPNQAVVEILETDVAFRSENCGVWEHYEARTTSPQTTVEDGDWVVGEQMEAGAYALEDTGAFACVWTRADGFEHIAQEEVASGSQVDQVGQETTVDLADGERFSSRHCGRWVKIG